MCVVAVPPLPTRPATLSSTPDQQAQQGYVSDEEDLEGESDAQSAYVDSAQATPTTPAASVASTAATGTEDAAAADAEA